MRRGFVVGGLRAVVLVLAVSSVRSARAQERPEGPIKGPADAIRRAQRPRPPAGSRSAAAAPPEGAELPQGHPPLPAAQQRVLDILAGRVPPVGRVQPSDEEPEGVVAVRVLEPDGRPAAGVTVELGILVQEGGGRQRRRARTDAQGAARFTGLRSGSGQAYRVSALSEGVRFAARPFRLEPGRGVRVELRRYPVTSEGRSLVLGLGHVEVSLKEGRVRVVEQIELWQLAEAAYRFPEDGLLLSLPEGFKALQIEERMGDPRLSKDERGVRLSGALMPGRATLLFAYDLPIEGETLRFAHPIPWKVARFRVVTEAVEGLRLDVEGMPAPRRHDVGGRPMWVTEIDRKPGAPPFDRLAVRLFGLPGPGPARWFGVAAAALFAFVGLGGAMWRRSSRREEGLRMRLREAREETLAERVELERERLAGEVGPEYHARRVEVLRERLAWILRLEARLDASRRSG